MQSHVRTKRILLLAVLLGALILVITRRPDAIFRAQFYGEDGLVWYSQAYSLGPWRALLLPRDGYFQTLPRLAAALSLLFPLRWAPLVMNVVGLVFQALPVCILFSNRLNNWASLPVRFLMASVYIALPNAAELHASVTEAHWHLALAAVLLVLAEPPQTRWGWFFDLALITLCGLSGPFVLPLVCVAAASWFVRRGAWRMMLLSVLGACGLLQGLSLLLAGNRPRGTLGASFWLFVQMLAAQIYEGALVGRNSLHRKPALTVVVAVLGTAIVVYCFARAKLEWRLFLFFCAVVFAGSLANPNAGTNHLQWPVLAGVWDCRYWFFPLLAFAWSLVWCAGLQRALLPRVLAMLALAVMLAYLPKTWRLDPADDIQFPAAAAEFEKAKPGQLVTLPVLPAGWQMQIIKK